MIFKTAKKTNLVKTLLTTLLIYSFFLKNVSLVFALAPYEPSSLGPSSMVDGSTGNENQPTFTFDLSDPDGTDQVKFRIQIDDNSEFSSPVVDYTSALAEEGSASFTIGQAVGSGSYTTGTESQTLSDGSYYWRVKAIDEDSEESSFSTANSGEIAFIIDTSTPNITSVSADPTSDGAVITWTTDQNSSSQVSYGLTSSYGNDTSESDTETRVQSHSVTITGLLGCTKYHYQAKSTDSANNLATSSDNTFTTTGCTGSSTVETETSSTITTDGGTLSLLSASKGITLTIPNAFNSSTAEFQIKKLNKSLVLNTTSSPSGKSNVGSYVYDLKSYTDSTTAVTSFDNSITVTFKYKNSDISNFDESSIKVYRWDGSNWHQLSGCSVNKSTNQISCTTNSFSIFSIFANILSAVSGSASADSGTTSSSYDCSDTKPIGTPDLFLIEPGVNSAKVYFNPINGIKKYYLSYSTKKSAQDHGVEISSDAKGVEGYEVQYLNRNTKYYFKVRGQNGCMPGDWSNTKSAKTLKGEKSGFFAEMAEAREKQIEEAIEGQDSIKGESTEKQENILQKQTKNQQAEQTTQKTIINWKLFIVLGVILIASAFLGKKLL